MMTPSVSQSWLLRGTYQQTDTGLVYKIPSWRQRTINKATGAVDDSDNSKGLKLFGWEVNNRAGASISTGIGFRLHKTVWIAGTWANATTTFVEVEGVKVPTANSLAMSLVGTDNNGFMFLSPFPFDWVSANVTTADFGAAPTYVGRYSGPSGWAALPTNCTFVDTMSTTAIHVAGEIVFAWQAPSDWTRINVTGAPAGMYGLQFRATTAPGTTAGIIGGVEIGTLAAVESVPDNTIWEVENETKFEANADAIVALFSTANGGNRVRCMVETA